MVKFIYKGSKKGFVCEMKKLEFNGSYYYNCSSCNESYGYPKSFDGTVFKFCPNCGHKIKKLSE